MKSSSVAFFLQQQMYHVFDIKEENPHADNGGRIKYITIILLSLYLFSKENKTKK